MRIENNVRTGNVAARNGGRSNAPGVAFQIGDSGAAPRASAAAPAMPAAPIDGLLALQAVEDSTAGRKRQLRRGRSLLDTLDALKADLLLGRIGDGHLNQLMALIGSARARAEPGLDALLDEIELRARVELAKRGLFPAG